MRNFYSFISTVITRIVIGAFINVSFSKEEIASPLAWIFLLKATMPETAFVLGHSIDYEIFQFASIALCAALFWFFANFVFNPSRGE